MRGRVHPSLVPAAGSSARGHLIEVDDAELAVLDRFEGPQYQRIRVRTGEHQVWAWRLRDQHRGLALDDDWDLERFMADDAALFLGGSRRDEEHPRAGA